MSTASPTAPQVLETYALLQIAAEAFIGREPDDPAAPPTGMAVTLRPEMLTRGNDHSSKMTTSQAAKFVNEWNVLSHQPSTATGFSATLFECLVDDPARGMSVGKGLRGQVLPFAPPQPWRTNRQTMHRSLEPGAQRRVTPLRRAPTPPA